MRHQDFTKRQRQQVRHLAEIAYQRALSAALSALENEFVRWRAAEIDPFELSNRIHRFHEDVQSELYKAYVLGDAFWSVVRGFDGGYLTEAEIPPDILAAVLDLKRRLGEG